MMLINKNFTRPVLKIFLVVFFFANPMACAANEYERYVLLAGPTFTASERYGTAADRYGAGGYVGFTKSPAGAIGLWPGIYAGAFYKDKLVTHLDFMASAGLGWIVLCGGVGLRTGEGKGPAAQVTYGITVGPTTAAIRRYTSSSGVMKEGLLTLNIPVYIF